VSDPELKYTGVDVLQALEGATNYNALLIDLILRSADGRRRILDFGVGIGTFAKLLRRHGVDVVCVEFDTYLANALAREGFAPLRTLDEVPDKSFEFIFALNVLEHIEDDHSVLALLQAKLTKAGRLLIYVPAFQCLWTSLDDKVKHYRRYRRADLEKLAQSAGLSVRESRYMDSLGFFVTLGFKILGNKHGHVSPRAVRIYDRFLVPLTRILDFFLGRLFGKNIYVVASKD
jgi:2-polyprenyl-3-methyl-5-hydroxy-6-metoxy-1,4-benzoquinol methylase